MTNHTASPSVAGSDRAPTAPRPVPDTVGTLESLAGRGVSSRRWLVRLGLASILLIVVDVTVRHLVPEPDFESRYTMPYNGLTRLRDFALHVRKQAASGRAVVVFLGESSARARIPAGSANIPELFSALAQSDPVLRGHHVVVYNFSVAGLDAASKFYIAEALVGYANMIILPLNLRGFATESRRAVPYPELWYELKPWVTPADREHLTGAPLQGESSRIALLENRLEDGLGHVVALWGRRTELKDLGIQWFHPKQWLAGALAADAAVHSRPGGRARTMWDEPLEHFPADVRTRWMAAYQASYDNSLVTEQSADLYFTRRTFSLVRENRTRLVVYAVPYSRWLNARWHFLEEPTYARNIDVIRTSAQGAPHVQFLNYNDPASSFDPVPGDHYSQGYEHWTVKANALFARRLFGDCRALLREAVR